MKFVFLNRDLLNASLVTDLRGLGHAVLVCSDAREADLVLKLHGKTVNLFLAHDQQGLALISALRSSPRFKALPVVLTHATWNDADFAKHRQSPEAAQGYLRYPCGDVELLKVFDQILGTALSKSGVSTHPNLKAPPKKEPAAPAASVQSSGIQLEDATASYDGGGLRASAEGDFVIDLPMPAGSEEPAVEFLSPVGSAASSPSEESAAGEGLAIVFESSASAGTAPEEEGSVVPLTSAEFGLGPGPGLQAHTLDGGLSPGATSISIAGGDSPLLQMESGSGHAHEPGLSLVRDSGDSSFQGEVGISLESVTPEAQSSESMFADPVFPEPAFAETVAVEPDMLAPPEHDSEPELESLPSFEDEGDGPTMMKTVVHQAAVQTASSTSRSGPRSDTNPGTGSIQELDEDALSQMPYLQRPSKNSPLTYTPPFDNALVPGGAANAPDLETLKRYLLLREQDVIALSAQLNQAKGQVANLEQQLRQERATNTEFAHLVQEQGRRIEDFDKEKEIALESAQKEVDDLRFELKRRADRMKLIEHQIREATQETEKLKDRVRLDIRKIRSREKELENRLEIMKRDSEALLSGHEQKIVELKRKLDLAEFNMDLLQDQLEKEKAHSSQLRAKLDRAAQVVRVAGGLLHPTEGGDGESIPDDKKDPAA